MDGESLEDGFLEIFPVEDPVAVFVELLDHARGVVRRDVHGHALSGCHYFVGVNGALLVVVQMLERAQYFLLRGEGASSGWGKGYAR